MAFNENNLDSLHTILAYLLMLEKHSTVTVQDRPLKDGVDEPIMTSYEISATDLTVEQFKEIHLLWKLHRMWKLKRYFLAQLSTQIKMVNQSEHGELDVFSAIDSFAEYIFFPNFNIQ